MKKLNATARGILCAMQNDPSLPLTTAPDATPVVIDALKALRKRGLLEKKDGKHYLTPVGQRYDLGGPQPEAEPA